MAANENPSTVDVTLLRCCIEQAAVLPLLKFTGTLIIHKKRFLFAWLHKMTLLSTAIKQGIFWLYKRFSKCTAHHLPTFDLKHHYMYIFWPLPLSVRQMLEALCRSVPPVLVRFLMNNLFILFYEQRFNCIQWFCVAQ